MIPCLNSELRFITEVSISPASGQIKMNQGKLSAVSVQLSANPTALAAAQAS